MTGNAFKLRCCQRAYRCSTPVGLSLRTFNICDGQGFRLAQAIRAVHIVSFDLMIMTDTNTTNQAYCCNRMVYDMVCLPEITSANRGSQGGVGLVVQNQPQGWIIELMRFHGPNVVTS